MFPDLLGAAAGKRAEEASKAAAAEGSRGSPAEAPRLRWSSASPPPGIGGGDSEPPSEHLPVLAAALLWVSEQVPGLKPLRAGDQGHTGKLENSVQSRRLNDGPEAALEALECKTPATRTCKL